MKVKDKFSILNNSNNNGVIAIREKPSVEIDENYEEVKMLETYNGDKNEQI